MKYMPIVQSTNSKYLSFENETSKPCWGWFKFSFQNFCFVEERAFESNVVVFLIFGNG